MPKELRLSRAEFVQLRKLRPQRSQSTFFSLTTYIPPLSIRGPKVACIVPKKNISKAALRKRITRRFREIIRINRKKLTSDHVYVFVAKKNISNTSYGDIISDLQSFFEQVVSGSTIHST